MWMMLNNHFAVPLSLVDGDESDELIQTILHVLLPKPCAANCEGICWDFSYRGAHLACTLSQGLQMLIKMHENGCSAINLS
jgi:hypothetical protein